MVRLRGRVPREASTPLPCRAARGHSPRMLMPEPPTEQPVVEVVADADHVLLVCRACPDRRRLPYDDLAVRVGVAAFVDEHTGCGPVLLRLPDAAPRSTVPA